MDQIREIQFVDLETNAPIFTVHGANVQLLLKNSQLLQSLAEDGGQANPNVLVVPIGDMGNGRQLLFRNILNGLPVGIINYRDEITYYPLPPEEEESIARSIDPTRGAANRNAQVNLERQQAIYETMRYLVIPDKLIQQMLVFDHEDYRQEFSSEDAIEQMLRTHIFWLFLTRQKAKLTPTELEIATEFFDKIERDYVEGMEEVSKIQEAERKRSLARHKRFMEKVRTGRYQAYNRNNNSSNEGESYADYRHREVDEEHEMATRSDSYEPPSPEETGGMTTRELERWLRTVYFKKAPLELNQLHLNTLFNENRRANRARVNRPLVMYYNENGKGNTTRKNTNKGKKNLKNKKTKTNTNRTKSSAGNTNGSAW